MRKFLNKVIAMFLLFAITISQMACGKKNEGENTQDISAKQGVYKEVNSMEVINQRLKDGGNLLAMEYNNDMVYTVIQMASDLRLYTWDKNGNEIGDVQLIQLSTGSGGEQMQSDTGDSNITQNVYDVKISSEGNVYFTINEYRSDQDGNYTEKNYLKGVDKNGTELMTVDIQFLADGEEDTSLRSFFPEADHRIKLIVGTKVYDLDNTGKINGKYDLPEGYTDIYSPAFYYKGEPVFTVYNYEQNSSGSPESIILDFQSGKVKQQLEIAPELLSQYTFYPGGASGYDYVLSNSTGLYGYTYGDAEPVLLMNYIASDLSITGFTNLRYISTTRILGCYYDDVLNENRMILLEHVNPSEIPDKKIISLAMYGTDTDMIHKVIAFNKKESEYKISVTDYSNYATSDDYSAGITVMNNEISAGKIPDIIYNNGNLNIDLYARKGMLADFYELIKTDSEVSLDNYCTNVFKAYESNGKLYELVYNYYIDTVIGKRSIFGDETQITWKKLNEVMNEYPEAASFRNTIDRETILNWALQYNYGEYVDSDKATCNFNSDSFKSVLEFASRFPESIDYDSLYNDDGIALLQEQQFMNNTALLDTFSITNLSDIRSSVLSQFGEDVTPVGFPNNQGQGSSIKAIGSLAIAERSENKQKAWEFVRQFILPEQQMAKMDESYHYGLPVYKEALNKLVSHMTEKPFYIDSETGEKVYYDNIVMINNEEVTIEPATKEEADRWMNFILSVDKKADNDTQEMTKIVSEEAAAYFEGQKTVDDVAQIIQSRMSIYLSENAYS